MIQTLITAAVILTAVTTTAIVATIAITSGAAHGDGWVLGTLLGVEMLTGGTSAAVLAGLATRLGATNR